MNLKETTIEEKPTVVEEHKTIIENSNKISNLSITSFQNYKIVKQLETSGAEADIFIVEKNHQKYILKLYRYGIKPKRELFLMLKKLSDSFPKDIVKIYKLGFDEKLQRAYEIQEFISLGSIKNLKNRKLNSHFIKHIIAEIAKILKTIHSANIIHRDLKPENILIRSLKPLDLVITDFGISSIMDRELSKIMTTKSGTRVYFAPESFSGVIGKEVDYWALGMIILELLTKKSPFDGVDEGLIAYTIHTKGVTIPKNLESDFKYLLEGLLTRNPKKRWGFREIVRWLKGDKNIPNYYEGGDEESYKKPYIFEKRNFFNLKELIDTFVINEEFWESGKAHFFRGYITKWLESNEDFDNSVKIDKLKEKEDKDLAFIEFIYTYNKELDFIFYGKLINQKNLLLFLKNKIDNNSSKAQKSIIEALLNGKLYEYYKIYLKITEKEDKYSFFLKEIYNFYGDNAFLIPKNERLEKLKSIFDYLDFLNSLDNYYLPNNYQKIKVEEVKYLFKREEFDKICNKYVISVIVKNDIINQNLSFREYKEVSMLFERVKSFIEKNFFNYTQKNYLIPKNLIKNLLQGDLKSFENANSAILELFRKNLFISKEEFNKIDKIFKLPDNLRNKIIELNYTQKDAIYFKKLTALNEKKFYIPKDFKELLYKDFYNTINEIDNFINRASFEETIEKYIIPECIIKEIKEGNLKEYKKAKECFNKLPLVSKAIFEEKKKDYFLPKILENPISKDSFEEYNRALYNLKKIIEQDLFIRKETLAVVGFKLPEYIKKYILNGEYDIKIANCIRKLLRVSKKTHFIPKDFLEELNRDFYATCQEVDNFIPREKIKDSFLPNSLKERLENATLKEYKEELKNVNNFLIDKEYIKELKRNHTFLNLINIKLNEDINLTELKELKKIEKANVDFNYFVKLDLLLKNIKEDSSSPLIRHLYRLYSFSIEWQKIDREIIDYLLNVEENIKRVPEKELSSFKNLFKFFTKNLLFIAFVILFFWFKRDENIFILLSSILFFIPIYLFLVFKIDDVDLYNLYFNKEKILLKNVDRNPNFRRRVREFDEMEKIKEKLEKK